jgi:hypothetical protein
MSSGKQTAQGPAKASHNGIAIRLVCRKFVIEHQQP